MRRCPWCKNNAHIKSSPLGYFAECEKNGHVHNIGVFPNAKCFCKTEQEAIEEWDKQASLMK